MDTTTKPREPGSDTPPNATADLEEVCRLLAAGLPVTDPELLGRIRERSEADQRVMREKHGVGEWAVELIREIRDEE
jgi:hypothetical protein